MAGSIDHSRFITLLTERFPAVAELPAGSYVRMPMKMRHFAWAKGSTIVQVHGMGPFELNYVNEADDPRKKNKE
jgi:hypothetical protein